MGRKFLTQKKQTMAELFDSLVRNAIDFVDASLDILDTRPKNGIVNFYTAIELFLKARLMAEHWTLVISKPEIGNVQSFSVGDFHSVALDDAAKRLKEIVAAPLPQRALDNFKALAEHRNQIVHFAHTDYSNIQGTKARVVVEQWASWHYLHELLTGPWKAPFHEYQKDFERLHARMLSEHDFLRVRFSEIEPEIKGRTSKGERVEICFSCNMPAALINATHAWGLDFCCLVCQQEDTIPAPTREALPCRKCGNPFEFFKKSQKSCPSCAEPVDADRLIEMSKTKYQDGDDWCEEGSGPYIAECHRCRYHKPSVFYIDGLWSCVSCFDRGWQATECPHCGKFVTGDNEVIESFACFKCEDKMRRLYSETSMG